MPDDSDIRLAREAVAPDRFKEVLASVPAPVAVVTALHEGRPHGTTVSAFMSLSLEPPLVVVSLDRGSQLLAVIREAGQFGVNVLHAEQSDHATRFARKGDEKFAGVEWARDRELPRLPSSAAWLACHTAKLVPGGDHVIVVGWVEHAERTALPPLIYRERAFAALAPSGAHG